MRGEGQSEILNFPIRTQDQATPGPSGSGLPDQEENTGPPEAQEPDAQTGAATEQSDVPEDTPGDGTQTDSVFSNYNNNNNNSSDQPLRRSARIPNAKPRELYPGSVKYV